MHNNDELFDKKVKERVNKEINSVPHNINRIFDRAINNIKKKRNFKKISGICAALIAGTLIVGITMPAYADEIPILGSIFKMFKRDEYKNYDKYSSDLNITKESNGLKVTIDKIVYDGIELNLFYTVESNKPMEKAPYFVEVDIKINGKTVSFGCGANGKFLNDNKTYVGMIDYKVNANSEVPKEVQEASNGREYVKIPDEFLLSYNISKIGEMDESYIVHGEWNFDIPVSSEKVNGKVKEFHVDVDLNHIYKDTKVNKVITTPINTAIQGKILAEGITPFEQLDFLVFDDKGRFLLPKGSELDCSEGNFNIKNKDGKSNYYFNYKFQEIYNDTEELTVMPFINIWGDSTDEKENTKLNLKGESKLTSKDGKELGTITKVEVANGRTKLYIKSNYSVYLIPREIVNNNTGETILPLDNNNDYWNFNTETIRYIKETGELVVEFNKELKDGDYTVSYKDNSKHYKMNSDDVFIVDVRK